MIDRDGRKRSVLLVCALGLVMALSPLLQAQSDPLAGLDADALISQLRDLPTQLYVGPFSRLCAASSPCGPPPLPPGEARRRQIYDRLYALGGVAVRSLGRALQSSDVRLRRHAALALSVLGGGWWFHERSPSKIDTGAALPALITALDDSDPEVRSSAAADIGEIGAPAGRAVPKLVALLGDADERIRDNACLGLRGVGPAAKSALPALQSLAMSDSSADVRKFARLAIDSIERPGPAKPMWVVP